ncbi:uncharacterized protein LOC105683856 [Athalia rosae]|uniref:uncharacterized protein LOC105683856 n=1 Tax=Athalia rosae TaxID=37344 RepID=UPI002033BFC7|nr:uncharacterized protein LOC105683856 [Athalia rosae]
MKLLALTVFLVLASAAQSEWPGERSTRASINDKLVALVEKLRETLKTGDAEKGIPCLNPLVVDGLQLSLDKDFASFDVNVTDLVINSLTDFEINQLTFSIIGVKFTFSFAWPDLTLGGRYAGNGRIANFIPLYGDGDFFAAVKNIAFSGTVRLSSKNQYLYVKSVDTSVAVGGLKVDVTGILNSDDVSSLISAVISDAIPDLMVDYQSLITGKLNDLIKTTADKYLGTMTLAELLAMLN